MRPLLALALKDIKILFRDRMGFFFTVIYPLVVAILFGSMFGGNRSSKPNQIALAIADEDSTLESRGFIDSLKVMEDLEIIETSRQDGLEKVRLSKVVGCVVIKKGFGEASKNLFWGDPPSVELAVDPSRRVEQAMLEGILMGKASQRFKEFFSNPRSQLQNVEKARAQLETSQTIPKDLKRNLIGLLDQVGSLASYQLRHEMDSLMTLKKANFTPIKIIHSDVEVWTRRLRNAYAITFPQAASWVFIAVTAGFSTMLVAERSQGTLMRLLVSPLPRQRVMLGKAIACFASMVFVTTMLFTIGYFGFGVVPNSIPMLALAVLCSAICFVSLAILLSSLGQTPHAVAGVTWATLLVASVFGGGMVPLILLPSWMARAGSFSPIKWAILSIEGAVWRQFTLREIIKPCGILLSMAALSLFVVFRLLPSARDYGHHR